MDTYHNITYLVESLINNNFQNRRKLYQEGITNTDTNLFLIAKK
ncbi:hypothetical protein THALO_30172 [Tenacibaculum halocynthiae]|nr:hypothetical protein SAMN04487765_2054 [Tenacibaculum sp. MAR_2010_89]